MAAERKDPEVGEVKDLGIAGGDLFQESLRPGVEVSEIALGSRVVSADDHSLGEVKRLRPNCIVVGRASRDLYVPLGSILEARGSRVVVNTLENQLDRLGWDKPPAE